MLCFGKGTKYRLALSSMDVIAAGTSSGTLGRGFIDSAIKIK